MLSSTQKKKNIKYFQKGTATSKNNESLEQLGFVTQRIEYPPPLLHYLSQHPPQKTNKKRASQHEPSPVGEFQAYSETLGRLFTKA